MMMVTKYRVLASRLDFALSPYAGSLRSHQIKWRDVPSTHVRSVSQGDIVEDLPELSARGLLEAGGMIEAVTPAPPQSTPVKEKE